MARNGLDEEQLRRWLTLLRRPDQLAEPGVAALLKAHGQLPESRSPIAIGQAAVDLLIEAIDRTRPPDGADRKAEIPYRVLHTCFVRGRKLYQAAGDLGMSTRQLTRERSRAIQVLIGELESGIQDHDAAPASRYLPEPIPSILAFMPRPAKSQALRNALEDHRLVHVHGPPGIGKTALVAELAHHTSAEHTVLWHRFRPSVSDTLVSLLFELGQHLSAHDRPELAAYLTGTLPTPDLTVATRLVLQALAGQPRLIVLDDYHTIEEDPAIAGLLDEAGSRVSDLRIITISRHRTATQDSGVRFEIEPLSRLETRALLERLSVSVDAQLADALHRWTGGICQLVKLAGAWLKTSTPEEVANGIESLGDTEGVQAFLLDSITELIGHEDHAVLRAASIFRDRFTDDALAFVAQRTRGEIQDASQRLVRTYLATRGRRGDVAFVHTSVRDYVYTRIEPATRAELHHRAALWYQRNQNDHEAEHHEEAAVEAEDELSDLGS